MAIDTASKRASASSFGEPYDSLIIPDGTIDQGDRQTVSNFYSGILAAEALIWTKQPDSTTSWSAQANTSTTWSTQPDATTTWAAQ